MSVDLPALALNTNPLPGSQPDARAASPSRILYSISARIGGSGLDSDCFEALRGAHRRQILARAMAYDNRQNEIPSRLITSLRWHPVRLLSFLRSRRYYGAKKHYLDWICAHQLLHGDYDLLHSWSGDCVRSFRAAKQRRITTVLEIPTWHRNKGKQKPALTQSERARDALPFPQRWLERLPITRQQVLEEYALADLILVLSTKAAETFTSAGVSAEKLFLLPRGTDIERFTPGTPPPLFRAIFSGALIKRKGVDLLLETWHGLNLKDAELVLIGRVHEEIRASLEKFSGQNVRVIGHVADPESYYRQASVHIFPSTCEGSAKVTYDAAACGLAQISTRESGDIVLDGLNGIVIPCGNRDALAAAIKRLYLDPELVTRMGAAGRRRVLENFTWDHYRGKLAEAYQIAQKLNPCFRDR